MKKTTTARASSARAAADSYVRVPDFAGQLAGVRFPPEVWAVFAQCDSPRSPAEIARRSQLDEKDVAAALRRLTRRHLVQKHHAAAPELDWQSYLAASTASTASPSPAPASRPSAPPHAGPLVKFTVSNERRTLDRQVATRDVFVFSVGEPPRHSRPAASAEAVPGPWRDG